MGVVLRSFYEQILLINLFLVLIGKFDQNPYFQPQLAKTRPYKSWIGPKEGEKVVFKELY